MLRAVQVGLRLSELDVLDFGDVMDMITESVNDTTEYNQVASQEDFNRF